MYPRFTRGNMSDQDIETCVVCGNDTNYKKGDNITFRSGYIEGSGQLCFECNQTKKMQSTGSYDLLEDYG